MAAPEAPMRSQSTIPRSIPLPLLNTTVIGVDARPDPLTDQPGARPSTGPPTRTQMSKDIFDLANDRIDRELEQGRLAGNYFLVVEPYKTDRARAGTADTIKGRARDLPVATRPDSSLLHRSTMGALRAASAHVGRHRPAATAPRCGPGSYDGIVCRLPQSVAPPVPVHRLRTRTHTAFGRRDIGPGSYTVREGYTTPRAPAVQFAAPARNLLSQESIAKLVHASNRIGPGTYDVRDYLRPKTYAAFITERVDDDDDRYEERNRPGPGTYRVRDAATAPRVPTAIFGRQTNTSMFEIASDGPGPAAYDLSTNLKQKPIASRSGTFGTASRFTKGGRVYQPVKRFHFRSALSKSDQGETAPTPPVPLPTSSPPETRATTPTPGRVRAIREKIMVKKSISVQIRKERERKRELWLRKLMARDFAALAADAMTAYQPEEEQRRKIQMMWVGLMMVASRAAWVGTVVDTYHANKDWILKVRWAVDVLQRWARRMSRKRRRAYQRRVEERFGRVWLLRLRQRQMREVITRKYQAAEVIKCMLQFERRKLLRGVKLFRHKITQLQRFWRGYLVQRNALADVIERQWVVLEQQVVSAYVDDEVKTISKATKSVKKRTATAAIREAVPVPRVDDAMRRIGTIVLARDVYREYVARTRAWLALEATEGRTGEPWIRAIVAPQRLLKAIKLAQQAALDDVIPPETKAKLAVIINRFVADLASHEIGVY